MRVGFSVQYVMIKKRQYQMFTPVPCSFHPRVSRLNMKFCYWPFLTHVHVSEPCIWGFWAPSPYRFDSIYCCHLHSSTVCSILVVPDMLQPWDSNGFTEAGHQQPESLFRLLSSSSYIQSHTTNTRITELNTCNMIVYDMLAGRDVWQAVEYEHSKASTVLLLALTSCTLSVPLCDIYLII